MEEHYTNEPGNKEATKDQNCGCADGNCKPKKKNIFSKILFAAILVAAVAIIGIRLSGRSDNVSGKQQITAPGKVSACDTTKTKACDTTKGSSCCSKK